MPPESRVVIFDFGGVLVDWNPRHLYRKLFDDAGEMEKFLAEVCTTQWNERQDAGRPWAEAVAELVARFPASAELICAYRKRWDEMVKDALHDSVAILDALKRGGHRLYGLTNWSSETFPLARARFRFFDWFDGIVVSGEEGLIKPDMRLYVRLLERYRIEPAGAVFIDDNRANVEAAVALGLHGIHFRSAPQLRDELAALGLAV